MSISSQEWKELTESKYWRPEVGKQYHVVMTSWRFERRAFKEEGSRDPNDEERRPTFVANVTNINGEGMMPPKEFASSNKALNRQMMAAVQLADAQGRGYIKLAISRSDARNYSVVDLALVDAALSRPVTPAVGHPQ
jgi:hypothetical protein